jgi:hypothetical protein
MHRKLLREKLECVRINLRIAESRDASRPVEGDDVASQSAESLAELETDRADPDETDSAREVF